MKKRGFTLIELLAVIIILAIIALIATPIVMRVIENSKKGAAERSAENYARAVETEIMALKANGTIIEDGIYALDSNGDVCLDSECTNKLEVAMTGENPSSGRVNIESEKVIGYSLTIGKYKNKYGIYSLLPSEYQEVEYLESTGTQYINTGVVADMDTSIALDFQLTNIADVWLFGARISSGDSAYCFGLRGGMYFAFAYNNSWNVDIVNYSDLNRHIISLNKNLLYFDGALKHTFTYPSTNFVTPYNLTIFGLNLAPYNSKYKCFSLIIYDNDVLVRNFIPCYRKSDNEAGMYDTVNGVFYTNQGSGDDFIVGDDV